MQICLLHKIIKNFDFFNYLKFRNFILSFLKFILKITEMRICLLHKIKENLFPSLNYLQFSNKFYR